MRGAANRIDTLPKRVVMFRPSVESRTSRNAGNDELGQNDTSVQVGNKTDAHHGWHGFCVGKYRETSPQPQTGDRHDQNFQRHIARPTFQLSREVVIVEANGKTRRLHPERSQAVKNHSPAGFNWGYGGSGSGQLTLALLLEVTHNEAVALACYHDFEARFIATIEFQHTDWEIPEEEIIGWLAEKGVVKASA